MKGLLVSRPPNWSSTGSSEDFHLKLSLDDRQQVNIAMDASLVHDSKECLGFRCDHIDLESMIHLRRLLELNLGDEERMLSLTVYEPRITQLQSLPPSV